MRPGYNLGDVDSGTKTQTDQTKHREHPTSQGERTGDAMYGGPEESRTSGEWNIKDLGDSAVDQIKTRSVGVA